MTINLDLIQLGSALAVRCMTEMKDRGFGKSVIEKPSNVRYGKLTIRDFHVFRRIEPWSPTAHPWFPSVKFAAVVS